MQYIGIDAGGTKTELLLSDEKGKRLRRALLPGVNAARMPVEQAAEALARGVAHLGGAADCLYAGIAGAGTPELARALRHEMEKWLPEVKRMEVASDAFNAMNGEIGLGNGLALIAGTGSSAFLRTEDGVLQIGGRGPLIDDGGSGYSVGRAVLNAAYRAMDGRGPETALIHAAGHAPERSDSENLRGRRGGNCGLWAPGGGVRPGGRRGGPGNRGRLRPGTGAARNGGAGSGSGGKADLRVFRRGVPQRVSERAVFETDSGKAGAGPFPGKTAGLRGGENRGADERAEGF